MAILDSSLPVDHRSTLEELESLVGETYQMWDEEWVGFTWRNYTFEHVQRVRALALALAEREGADRTVLEYAGLLHDITKGYDGEIVEANGERQLDANGFWRNHQLAPAHRNLVTDLYDKLGLAGSLHNESGAAVADFLLTERGLPAPLRERITTVIRAHLRPVADAGVEERILYDADTIDANIGLPAFHRNLYIMLHREEIQRQKDGEDFAAWIDSHRREFIAWHLTDKVPSWVSSRRQTFLDRLMTETGRRLAEARYDRLIRFVGLLAAELGAYEAASREGGLAIVQYLIENRQNPRMSEQVRYLASWWAARPSVLARDLLAAMQAEMNGLM